MFMDVYEKSCGIREGGWSGRLAHHSKHQLRDSLPEPRWYASLRHTARQSVTGPLWQKLESFLSTEIKASESFRVDTIACLFRGNMVREEVLQQPVCGWLQGCTRLQQSFWANDPPAARPLPTQWATAETCTGRGMRQETAYENKCIRCSRPVRLIAARRMIQPLERVSRFSCVVLNKGSFSLHGCWWCKKTYVVLHSLQGVTVLVLFAKGGLRWRLQ